MQEEFNTEEYIKRENYKETKKMIKKYKIKSFIALRDRWSMSYDIDDWDEVRESYSALFTVLKEILWYAEEVEDYEFCAKLVPIIDECSKYCDKMAEELEHFYS